MLNLFGFNSPWLATKGLLVWVGDTPQLAAGLFIVVCIAFEITQT